MKTPAQASAKYGANASSAAASTLWATNLTAVLPAAFDAAAGSVTKWQNNVSTPLSATKFKNGLARAKNKITQINAKINGPAKATYSAGTLAASQPGGAYSAFAAAFLPAVASAVTTLDSTFPRGTPTQNRARLNAYLDWLEAQAGNFTQK